MMQKYNATLTVEVSIETTSWANAGHAFDDLVGRIEGLALDGETIAAHLTAINSRR